MQPKELFEMSGSCGSVSEAHMEDMIKHLPSEHPEAAPGVRQCVWGGGTLCAGPIVAVVYVSWSE